MAFQIRVVPDVLRQSAEHIDQIINDNEQLYTRIKVITSKLDESWDGTASEYMIQQLHELLAYSNQTNEAFFESRSVLEAIAQAFENIDNSNGEESTGVAKFKMTQEMKEQIKRMSHIVGPGGQLKISSGNIRVVPDGLREAAQEAHQMIDMSNDIADRIDKVLSELQSSWEGNAFNRFSDNFIQLKKFYIALNDSLEEFAQKVNMVANKYEEIDNMLA